MTTSGSSEVCLTRLISKYLTSSLKIEEELSGSIPGRIIIPQRSGPRSTYSLAFMFLFLVDLKTASKRPKDSFFQRAYDFTQWDF